MSRRIILLSLLLLWLSSSVWSDDYLQVEGRSFRDGNGNEVILHGINIGFASRLNAAGQCEPRWEHRGGADDFKRIRQWGFNCVRMPIYWAGLEPEPGKYDEAFLRELDEKISWAAANDLYVIIDMHQDLWGVGVPGARGAPAWALKSSHLPHLHDPSVFWGLAYLESPRVQGAFDAFWTNQPDGQGVGIQDRYAQAWKHLAQRYADNKTVIGYDLMNEPFQGSILPGVVLGSVIQMLPLLQQKGIKLESPNPAGQVLEAYQILQKDLELYKQWLKMVDPALQTADKSRLMPMYKRVTQAIREVDKHHLIFTSASITANYGIANGVGLIGDDKQVFSPHAYHELWGILEMVITRQIKQAELLDIPLFVGEWGNLENGDAMYEGDPLPAARQFREMMERCKFSAAYWDYRPDLDQQRSFANIIARPYAERVGGDLVCYDYDEVSRDFSCRYLPGSDPWGSTVIFVPNVCYPKGFQVELNGCSYQPEPIEDSEYGRRLRVRHVETTDEIEIIVRPGSF